MVLIVGLTTMFGLLDVSLKATASTRAREGATNLARGILEDAHTIPYAQLSPSAITGQLQAMNGLTDDLGRRGLAGRSARCHLHSGGERVLDR